MKRDWGVVVVLMGFSLHGLFDSVFAIGGGGGSTGLEFSSAH